MPSCSPCNFLSAFYDLHTRTAEEFVRQLLVNGLLHFFVDRVNDEEVSSHSLQALRPAYTRDMPKLNRFSESTWNANKLIGSTWVCPHLSLSELGRLREKKGFC